jgi:hypothetical protein
MPHETAHSRKEPVETRSRPWLAHWTPIQAKAGQMPAKEDVSTGEVEGFKAGQRVLLGGVAGNFDTVLYDTKDAK